MKTISVIKGFRAKLVSEMFGYNVYIQKYNDNFVEEVKKLSIKERNYGAEIEYVIKIGNSTFEIDVLGTRDIRITEHNDKYKCCC